MIETNAITTFKQIPKKNSNRTFLIDSHSGKQIQYKTLDEKAKGIGKLSSFLTIRFQQFIFILDACIQEFQWFP